MATQKKQLGNFFIFISALGFSFGGFFIKLVPWSGLSINAGRNFIAVIITFIYLKFIHHKIIINKSVIFTAIASCLTCTLFCVATKMTSAANAIVLQYTSPIFVILVCWIGLKQLPTKRDLVTCGVVFLGILCFFLDSFSGGSVLGDVIALLSGLTYAVVFMANTIPKNDSLSAFFIGQIFCTIIGIPSLLQETVFTPTVFWGVLALGLILGIGYVLLAVGLKSTTPLAANLLSTAEPLFNPVWVALFYGEHLSPLSIIGFIIVLSSVVYYCVFSKTKS